MATWACSCPTFLAIVYYCTSRSERKEKSKKQTTIALDRFIYSALLLLHEVERSRNLETSEQAQPHTEDEK